MGPVGKTLLAVRDGDARVERRGARRTSDNARERALDHPHCLDVLAPAHKTLLGARHGCCPSWELGAFDLTNEEGLYA
jgi:hypothetical protein